MRRPARATVAAMRSHRTCSCADDDGHCLIVGDRRGRTPSTRVRRGRGVANCPELALHGSRSRSIMELREAVIVDAVRTPIGKRKGALAGWHPTDLLALTLNALIDRTGLDPERVDDVIGGNVTQVGEQGCNVTRNAWVAAGLPQTVSATSVDRQCGSSQQAVHFAAQGVMCGAYDIAIACGVESMTRAPMASNAVGRHRPVLAGLHGRLQRPADDPVRGRPDPGRQGRHHPRGDGRVRRRVAPPGARRTGTAATSPARSYRCRSRTRTAT